MEREEQWIVLGTRRCKDSVRVSEGVDLDGKKVKMCKEKVASGDVWGRYLYLPKRRRGLSCLWELLMEFQSSQSLPGENFGLCICVPGEDSSVPVFQTWPATHEER